MQPNEVRRETVALTRNKLYKTYQFHGSLGRGKDANVVFKTAIAEIFLWLRERFREFDEVPSQIVLPENVSKITDELLKSFRIEDGYIIESVHIAEKQIWSFRLTETDMGTKERLPVPGRLFISNFGLRVVDGIVEMGCQTICSQPEIIAEDAEVFRPKVVRTLKDKLGLFSIFELEYKAGDLSEVSTMKKFKSLLEDKDRNMPIVVIESKCKNIEQNILIPRADLKEIITKSTISENFIPKPTTKIIVDRVNGDIIADQWARSLCGFAYVFRSDNGTDDSVKIYYPGKNMITMAATNITDNESAYFEKKFLNRLMNYTKRNDLYKFGKVCFLPEALAIKQEMELERLRESENCIDENLKLKQVITRLKEEKIREEQSKRDFAEKYQEEKEKRKEEENRLKINKRIWEDERDAIKKENLNLKLQLGEHEGTISVFEAKDKRPSNIVSFIKWVEEYFKNDIILFSRAKDELKKAKNCDIDVLCDAIEVLAYDYKQRRLGEIAEDKYIEGCKSRGKTSFKITPSGDASVKQYSKKYKIFYDDNTKDKSKRRALNWHLKNGNDSKFLLRVYFF